MAGEPMIIQRDDTVDRWASRVLRIGVWTSATLMTAALILAAIHGFRIDLPDHALTLPQLAQRLFTSSFDPVTLGFTGLVVLMLTPILRVITAIVGFAVERDRRFVLVSVAVLVFLLAEVTYSLFIK